MAKINFETMTEKDWDKVLQDLEQQKPSEMWVEIQHD